MKHIRITISNIACLLFAGCKKYLDYQPQGALYDSELLATSGRRTRTAAYAGIANDWLDAPITSNGNGEAYALMMPIKAVAD